MRNLMNLVWELVHDDQIRLFYYLIDVVLCAAKIYPDEVYEEQAKLVYQIVSSTVDVIDPMEVAYFVTLRWDSHNLQQCLNDSGWGYSEYRQYLEDKENDLV